MYEIRFKCRGQLSASSPYADATSRARLYSIGVLLATIICACASSQNSSRKPVPNAAISDRHIYVTSGDVDTSCYRDLGPVSINETFAQSVVQSPDSQAQQLRELARQKFPDRADAVIKVHEQQNDAGTAVEVSGEAVQLVNHETVGCAARAMPGMVDTAGAAAGAGVVGTVIGGLIGGSTYGAEGGGAIGATAGAGAEIAKQQQQKHAQEAFISDRLEQQRVQIAQLYQQLTKLIGQQCDNEELSEQDCERRIIAVQQEVAKVRENDPQSMSTSQSVNSAAASSPNEFDIRNRIQAQQEVINQLQHRIADISRDAQNR